MEDSVSSVFFYLTFKEFAVYSCCHSVLQFATSSYMKAKQCAPNEICNVIKVMFTYYSLKHLSIHSVCFLIN